MNKLFKYFGIEQSLFVVIGVIYFYYAQLYSSLSSREIIEYIFFYFSILLNYLFPFVFIFWSIKSIVYLFKNKDQGFLGLADCWSILKKNYLSKFSVVRFMSIFILIPFFNFSYSSLKQTIPIIDGNTVDPILYKLDFIFHGRNTPWDLLQPILGNPLATRVLDILYLCWGSLFLYTLLWISLSHRRILRLQFLLSLMFSWIIIGNILARLFASAGPCYFIKVVKNVPNPYESMMVYLRSIPDLKAVQIQDILWQSHVNNVFMPLGGISAMPSMHVSIAVLLALVYYKINPWLGSLFAVFATTILLGSVHLGWHYAIDGYLSTLFTVMIWKVVERFTFIADENQAALPLNKQAKCPILSSRNPYS